MRMTMQRRSRGGPAAAGLLVLAAVLALRGPAEGQQQQATGDTVTRPPQQQQQQQTTTTPPTTTTPSQGGTSTTPATAPVGMRVLGVSVRGRGDTLAGMGDWLVVRVDSLREAVRREKLAAEHLVLFLDGQRLDGTTGKLLFSHRDEIGFELDRTATNREAWRALLGSPTGSVRRVEVGVGRPQGAQIPPADTLRPPGVGLVVFNGWRLFLGLLGLAVALGLFLWLARSSDILRDPQPLAAGDKRRPYSMGRSQMAFWFFLIVGAYLFLYLITGDHDTLNAQALVLLGIGTVTALGAAAIDDAKRSTAMSRLATLAPQEAALAAEAESLDARAMRVDSQMKTAAPTPELAAARESLEVERAAKEVRLAEVQYRISDVKSRLTQTPSESFFLDLLTDAGGVSLHRFQMLAWTVVLGVVFVFGVYRDLSMPQFDTILLALMGISAGTYLGFKVPERQSEPAPTPPLTPTPGGATPGGNPPGGVVP